MDAADPVSAEQFASSLDEHPFTVDARCALRRGLGSAWIVGPPRAPRAAVVTSAWLPSEPMAFGDAPEDLWLLLRGIAGWSCVNVAKPQARELAEVLERELRSAVRLLDDVYYVLEAPAIAHTHPLVRRLTEDDLETVDRAPPPLQPHAFPSTRAALLGGIAAGAIHDGDLVSSIAMTTCSERFADLGGHTLEPWRNQGLGSAGAFLVAKAIQSRGFTPVWSTGEDNVRSRRVAEKLGFRELGRKTYVVVPALQDARGYRPPSGEGV